MEFPLLNPHGFPELGISAMCVNQLLLLQGRKWQLMKVISFKLIFCLINKYQRNVFVLQAHVGSQELCLCPDPGFSTYFPYNWLFPSKEENSSQQTV